MINTDWPKATGVNWKKKIYPLFEGRCAKDILHSATSVKAGHGDPCGSKDTRVTDVLETMEVPENGHTGIRAAPHKKAAGLNCPNWVHLHQCTQHGQQTGVNGSHGAAGKLRHSCSMEPWWDHTWLECWMDGYKPFRRDRWRRRGSGVALYVKDYLKLNCSDERVECFWARIRRKGNRAHILVGVCYRPLNHNEEADELFYKQLGLVSWSLALVLEGDSNLPDVCWKYSRAERKQTRRLLESVWYNFLIQLVSEPKRKSTQLDLLLVNTGLGGDVMTGGHLGHMDHEIIVSVSWRNNKRSQQNCNLELPTGQTSAFLGCWLRKFLGMQFCKVKESTNSRHA